MILYVTVPYVFVAATDEYEMIALEDLDRRSDLTVSEFFFFQITRLTPEKKSTALET